MLNKNLLCGEIAKAGYRHYDVAKMLGMSKNTFSSRINGRKGFNTDEIDILCEVLKIYDNEYKSQIFLSSKSQNRDEMKAG